MSARRPYQRLEHIYSADVVIDGQRYFFIADKLRKAIVSIKRAAMKTTGAA